jgi:predicted O-methyltransferase YrrM
MENLPVVLLSEEKGFDGYYIIPNTRFARESLELLGVSHERIIEHQGEDFYVETLYIPKKIPGWRLDEFPEVIDKLRNRLLESAGFIDEKTKKRIYISRNKLGSQRRIVINEDALLKLLEEFGFETIYTEEMSLKEQILTMANAEALITPHGSGMVHTLFMPHGSLVIELFAPTYINPCMLSVIKHLRHRYYMVTSYLNKVPPVYDHGWDIEAYLNVIEITMEREIGKSTKVTIKHDEATGSTLKEERISYLKLEDFLKNIKGVPNAHGMIEINDVRGYLVPGDVEYLFNKATELPKNGVIIEIGSFMGLSSIIMASALLSNNNYKAKIYCVDTWEGSPEHKNLDEVKSKQLYEIFLENIKKYKVNSIIYPIRKPSVEAANEFEDLSADFIFIDGDHSYESCYSDLVSWYPKLKEGGILFGHDCVPGSGVSEAVEKFSKEYNINYKIYDFPKTHYMFEIHKPFSDCLSNDKV